MNYFTYHFSLPSKQGYKDSSSNPDVHESLELPNKIHCARFTDLRQSEISHIRDLPIKYRSLGKMGYLGLFEDSYFMSHKGGKYSCIGVSLGEV